MTESDIDQVFLDFPKSGESGEKTSSIPAIKAEVEVQPDFETKVKLLEDRLLAVITHHHQDLLNVVNRKINRMENTLDEKLTHFNVKLKQLQSQLDAFKGKTDSKSAICGYRQRIDGRGNNRIIFDTVHVEANDIGCHLDANTGVYTAGKSGVYEVSVSFGVVDLFDNGELFVHLKSSPYRYKDEEEFFHIILRSKIWDSAPISGSRFISLNKGETLYLVYNCTSKCHMWHLKFCVSYYAPTS